MFRPGIVGWLLIHGLLSSWGVASPLKPRFSQQTGELLAALPAQQDSSVQQLENLKNAIAANGETLPQLVKQLETEAANTGEHLERELGHLTIPSSGTRIKTSTEHSTSTSMQTDAESEIEKEQKEMPPVKAFPGAARLLQGQHEVPLPNGGGGGGENLPIAQKDPKELTGNVNRRGGEISGKNEVSGLQRYSGGQYSPLDMAQYVFWTGDEGGVARAVQEFIQEGLMTREEAISFLRDIRVGIEYLQGRYDNKADKAKVQIQIQTHTTSTTPMPVASNQVIYGARDLENSMKTLGNFRDRTDEPLKEFPEKKSLTSNSVTTLSSAREPNLADYDEVAGRLRLADFLYTEYSLEEVIYQLAKVMFTESLSHASGTHSAGAGEALQRLTEFLGNEGSHGRIPKTLQKKVLDVLLVALSDTLGEHPELLGVAREHLGRGLNEIQSKRSGIKM